MVIAYLDPMTGGVVLQTIIAAAVAAPFILRAQIARGIARLKGVRAEPPGRPADEDGSER